MKHVTVYPTKASALNVKHPHGPKMALAGVLWPQDGFTGRMISDRIATEDKAKAYVPPAAATEQAPAAAETMPADQAD